MKLELVAPPAPVRAQCLTACDTRCQQVRLLTYRTPIYRMSSQACALRQLAECAPLCAVTCEASCSPLPLAPLPQPQPLMAPSFGLPVYLFLSLFSLSLSLSVSVLSVFLKSRVVISVELSRLSEIPCGTQIVSQAPFAAPVLASSPVAAAPAAFHDAHLPASHSTVAVLVRCKS